MFFSFIQTGCSQELAWSEILQDVRKQHPNVVQLSTDSLSHWLATPNATQPLLIDIREKKEYEVSHLAGAIHMDPDTRKFKALKGVDKDAPIVVYCSVGYRSSKMAEKIKKAGFSYVANLEGSIFTWANEGHPVVRDEEEVKAVHPLSLIHI